MGKQAASVDSQVLARMRQQGPGTAFTPADFVDLGPRNAVDLALSRNARAGTIRKLARGVYDLPRRDARLGTCRPPRTTSRRLWLGATARGFRRVGRTPPICWACRTRCLCV